MISFIASKNIAGANPYFFGFAWGREQFRIGLIWWHIVFIFE